MSVKAILYGQNYTKQEMDERLNSKQNSLSFDDMPERNSNNPVKSGGIYTALSGKQNTLEFDNTPDANSDHPVKSRGIYTALSEKLDKSAVTNTVESGNNNPVSSNAVHTAIQGLAPGGESITPDDALSSTSTNSVQNKVIYSALANKVNTSALADYATNSALEQKAPTNHASSATTYGVGTSFNYGHLKITDSIRNTAASDGIAISPKAVYDLRTTVLGKQDALSSTNVLPITSGGTGNANLGADSTGSTRAVVMNTSGTALTTRPLVDSTTHIAFSNTSPSLVTERAVYYALPKINNDHTYDNASNFYAPTSAGTVNQILTSSGSGAPTWKTLPSGGFLSTNADGELVGRGSTGNWSTDSPPYSGVFNANSSSTAGTLPIANAHTATCMVFNYDDMSTWTELYMTQRVGTTSTGIASPRLFQRNCLNGTMSDWVEYVQRPIDGTIAASIIPDLNASKITAGTLAVSVIPNLNASKITAGTLPIARGGTGATSFAENAAIISNSNGTALITRSITNNTTAASLTSSSDNLITERSVWNALPYINDVSAVTYNRSTKIYAPTSAGTSGQILVSNGSGAPTWGSISSNLPSASTSTAGIVKLSSATNSTSTSLAATASAVKSAYDLANGIKSNISNLTCKTFSNKSSIVITHTAVPFYMRLIISTTVQVWNEYIIVKTTTTGGVVLGPTGDLVTANFTTSGKITLTFDTGSNVNGWIEASDTFTIS